MMHPHRFDGQVLAHSHAHDGPHGYYGHDEDRLPHEPSATTGSYEPPSQPVAKHGTPVFLFSDDELDVIERALEMHAHTLDESCDYAGVLAKIKERRS